MTTRPMTPREVLALCREREVKAVDLRFMDFPGMWQHFTVPVEALTERTFTDGIRFDGSSIRGWRAINESDLLVVPQPDTAFIDPFTAVPTLTMICNIQDPVTRRDYSRDPRNVARKAVAYMQSSGIADEAHFGPELEFFVFDDIRYEQDSNRAFYFIDSIEGRWNMGREEAPNLGFKIRYREGYFPVPPSDTLQDLRTEIMLHLIDCGVEVEAQHHEVATGGQCEIDMKYKPLVEMADAVLKYKYIAKNVARRNGKVACFMPKPLLGDNGSGMHTHFSLWKEGEPLFAGTGYAGLSDTALFAIGGILAHAPALLAFCAPTTNSYKRLVPGFESPVHLTYSQRNRSAAIRVPVESANARTSRIEFRCPDCSCNPYLAFAAMLMAALDGIQSRLEPGPPLDKDMYNLEPEDLATVRQTPSSLDEALEQLRNDHDFLLRGDVFTPDVIDTWIWYKKTQEADEVRQRPHPYEFVLYADI